MCGHKGIRENLRLNFIILSSGKISDDLNLISKEDRGHLCITSLVIMTFSEKNLKIMLTK